MRTRLDACLRAVNEVLLGKEAQVRLAMACLLASTESGMTPPAKLSGSSLPRIRSASVTVGFLPPRW